MDAAMYRLFHLLLACCALIASMPLPAQTPSDTDSGKIAPYQARFGRARPVVAIVGENRGTELMDFAIPYGVLARSGSVDLYTVSTQPGALQMRPGLRIEPQTTIADFDARFPDGADYVIVPAVVHSDDATLLAWVAAQGAKGGTVVSICDGALVVANSGLLKGHRGTAHWATEALRKQQYPDTRWIANTRYVADGKVVSSAGISAAMPTALALVEAISGKDKATEVARQLGVSEWGTAHDSDRFHPRLGRNLLAFSHMYTNAWLHSTDSIGAPVSEGVDEIALAIAVDAWSRTSRSKAYSVAASDAPLHTRGGLTVLPDRVDGAANAPRQMLPAFDQAPPALMFDQTLARIADTYGRSTAYLVALDLEYPAYQP